MFCCVPLALASQKERRQQLIILHVQNINLNEFRIFSFHSSFWMHDAKFGRNLQALEGIF